MTDTLPHLLVVDDDKEIRSLLGRFLAKHGFRVSEAADGRAMREAIANGRFDLVVLDLMLPGEDGLSLCRWLRGENGPPIIMLTAMGEDTDRIVGLELGADDYLPKPFNPRELLARIKAVLRRAVPHEAPARQTAYRFNGWTLLPETRELRDVDNAPVDLTSGEYDLLLALAERPNRVLSRDQLLDLTRGREAGPFDRSIDVLMSRLRRKIEPDPKLPALLKTVRGGGYMFAARVSQADDQ